MGKFIVMAAAAAVFAVGVIFLLNRMPEDEPPAQYGPDGGDTIQRVEDAVTIPEDTAVENDDIIADTEIEADTEGEVTVETIEETVVESGVVIAEEGETDDPMNNEAAPDADTIGVAEASDPGFIANALTVENFQAERAVALIQNSTDLTDEQKVSLMRSVQAVAEDPEALEAVLEEMRALMIN